MTVDGSGRVRLLDSVQLLHPEQQIVDLNRTVRPRRARIIDDDH